MKFSGTVIRESLADPMVLEHLNIAEVETWDVGDSSVEWQPRVWTAMHFEGPKNEVETLATALAKTIYADRPWYANMSTSTHAYVIFHDNVIKYRRGDLSAYRLAQDYARSIGVPEHQIVGM